MRIISGSLKGLRLNISAKARIRPTAGKIREALFNALGPKVFGVDALDLFAGSGAIGIEALSRGAKSVTMVEKDLRLARSLQQFCAGLKTPQSVKVLNMDAMKCLDYLSAQSASFGVIFMDPPYDTDWVAQLLTNRSFLSLILPGGLVVVETSSSGNALPNCEDHGLQNIFSRKYGSSRLEIFSSVESDLNSNLESN